MEQPQDDADGIDRGGTGLSRRAILGYASAAAVVGLAVSGRPSSAHGATFSTQALGDAVGWNGYLNGQVPIAAMTAVNYPNNTPFPYPNALEQIYMRPDAAIDLVNWLKAYYSKFGTYLKLNEGYRTLAGQQYWADQAAAGGDEAAPVGRSNHGLGQAIDFERSYIPEGSAKLQWVRDTATTYGFVRYAGERWHFDYTRPWRGTTAPVPAQEEDDDMAAIVSIKNAQGNMDYWMIDDGQATRWNAILGLDVNSAGQRLDWYRARGMKFYENQPPHFIIPYVDITSKRAAGQA
jgi:hypothetical protein